MLVGVEDARFAVQTIKEKKTGRREGKGREGKKKKKKKKNRGGVALQVRELSLSKTFIKNILYFGQFSNKNCKTSLNYY
jgi:hypothetical protein